MPNRLIKWFSSSPGRSGKGSESFLSRPMSRSSGWISVALIFIGLGLLGGCVNSSNQVLTAQTLAQMKATNPGKELQQQQLMLEASKATLVDYKGYKVGPEDVLAIEIFGQDKLNRVVRVNAQGEITLPLVGVVKVGGLTPQEIETRLRESYDSQFLVNPQITVAVKEVVHQRVAVTGAVPKPGNYEIIGPRSLLEVLSLAGGFIDSPASGSGPQAGDVIQVIRHQNASDLAKAAKGGGDQPSVPKTEIMVIDLRRLVSGQSPELNITVQNGDVVYVPFAGSAYILGGVKKPGNISVKQNLTVSQAVALGGGVEPILGTNDITIMRIDENGKPINIDTNLNSIIARRDPDLPIKDNDVVVVRESFIKKTIFVIRTLLPVPTPSTTF